MEIELRKIVTTVEEIHHDGGPVAEDPLLVGGVCAVVHNPFAGDYVDDLQGMMEALKPLGLEMAKRLVAAMGATPQEIEAYGKGSIVGSAGELEHGALWHAPGGYGMREVLGGAKAIVPSTKKVGGVGACLDVPLHHINAAYVRSHFNTIQLGVADAPRPNELVFCLAMANGPRIHARMGGLAAADVIGEDGLR